MAKIHAICVDQQMVLGRNNRTTCPITNGVGLLISLDASFCMENRNNISKILNVFLLVKLWTLINLLHADGVSSSLTETGIYPLPYNHNVIIPSAQPGTVLIFIKKTHIRYSNTSHSSSLKSTYGPLAIFSQ